MITLTVNVHTRQILHKINILKWVRSRVAVSASTSALGELELHQYDDVGQAAIQNSYYQHLHII